jgi:hypothetical protein
MAEIELRKSSGANHLNELGSLDKSGRVPMWEHHAAKLAEN